MRVHWLQHVDFEGPAAIAEWALERGYALSSTHLNYGEALPQLDAFDLLVVMGGPMSVNDEREFPWLVAEKERVRQAIEAGKAVFGVCLGAQMIASAMGERVYRGAEKEIGWFPVSRVTDEGIGALFPEEFTPLHWHGETFELPAGAVRLAQTGAVPNQAFQLGERVLGLQFHLEATVESVRAMLDNTADEIEEGKPFQQAAGELLKGSALGAAAVRPVLWRVLDRIAETGR